MSPRFKGPLYAGAAVVILSLAGLATSRGTIQRTGDILPFVSLAVAAVTVSWVAYNHIRQYELMEIQIKKFNNDIDQYRAWKVIADIEKYSSIRNLFNIYMLSCVNDVLLAYNQPVISKLSSIRDVPKVDDILASATLTHENRINTLYKTFLSIISSLENHTVIERDFLPYDEIHLTYLFLNERWHSAHLHS